jgi:hypothetical protein
MGSEVVACRFMGFFQVGESRVIGGDSDGDEASRLFVEGVCNNFVHLTKFGRMVDVGEVGVDVFAALFGLFVVALREGALEFVL